MHMASDSGPLFFSDIAPIDSSSTRIAAEAFYHCLGAPFLFHVELSPESLLKLWRRKT
jgi:hypothetical protein